MSAELANDRPVDAIVVLGCRVEVDGTLSRAATARCEAAARGFLNGLAPLVIASGGRRWGDQVEALCFRDALVRLGVPRVATRVELCSLTTAENAVYSAALLRQTVVERAPVAAIATSAWHLPRALANFARVDIRASGLAALDLTPSLFERARRSVHESVSHRLDMAALARSGRLGRAYLPAFLLMLLCGLANAACSGHGDKTPNDAGPIASASASSSSSDERLRRIETAEQERRPSSISNDDQSSRDVTVRRRAARALARIASAAARPGLLRALSDEDPEVIAWAAYGLGVACETEPVKTVSALAARAIDLPSTKAAEDAGVAEVRFDPFSAIARAIGRCNAPTSEPTLTAWLSSERSHAVSAALGLGDLGSAQKRLREETIATLLTLAAGSASNPPVPEALFPIARVENVPPSVVSRLLDVAAARLGEKSDYRLFAVRALSRAKEGALPHLERVLFGAATFSAPERIEAARALGKLGADGKITLSNALKKIAVDATSVAKGGEGFDVPLSIVLALSDAKDSKDTLTQIAALSAPDGATPSARRRFSMLRCAAAKLLADQNFNDPLLAICDLDKAGIGTRALVDVVGKGTLEGPRLQAFQKLLADRDVRTREGALELLSSHHEVPGASKLLVQALGEKEPGIVAAAAEQISKAPILASQKADQKVKGDKKKQSDKDPNKKKANGAGSDAPPSDEPEPLGPPLPEVVTALKVALERAQKDQDLELLASVVDALGALSLKELSPKLEELCSSTYPVARAHAASALGLLTGKKRVCQATDAPGPQPPELTLVAGAKPLVPDTTLVLETDAGELRIHLDVSIAPVAVARFVDLAKTGYYDGDIIHRVDPSFVVQFGSPFGDGAGGPDGRAPLRCETSPLAFEELSVGVALAGRDSGSSQLFVMRARHPSLDGSYAWVGKAEGPWNLVSEGDVIHSVKLE